MEKLTRNRFESAVQDVTDKNKDWLKDEFKSILESNKPYQSKCDYIGYSISSIDLKIQSVDDEIKQLQEYKKRLKTAKDIASEIGAAVFNEYGISKIEGNGISSITTTTGTVTTKVNFDVTDEDELIHQGFYKKVIDMDKIKKYYADGEYVDLIKSTVDISKVKIARPSKLRINKRKAINNTEFNAINISDIDLGDWEDAS